MAYAKKKTKRGSEPRGEIDVTHGTLIRWVNEADDATVTERFWSERSRDYYDSRQISDAEAKAMKARKQAPVVINRVKPKMDGLMGMEKMHRTTAKAYPRTPAHDKAADAATHGIRFVLDDNAYPQIRSAAWDNMLVEGSGGCEVIITYVNDEPRITVNPIMWDRMIHDPHGRKKDFSDCKFLGQVVWMDFDDALELYPEGRNALEYMQSGSSTYADKPRWMDNTRRRVKICELYWKEDGEVWYGCFTYGGWLKAKQKSPYVDEEKRTVWPYEFGSLFVSREGDRYGAMLQLLDVQDEINKRRSKALHLMSVRQVRWERGAVDDINKAREELAKPDGVLETTPGMEFEVLKTGDMAAAQFNLLAEAKGEIDSVGYNAAASGKDTRAQSGVALRERTVSGQTEIAPMFDVLKHLDVRVYRKIWNLIRQYWKKEKWLLVTDDGEAPQWVGLNAPVTRGQKMLEQAKANGARPEQLQMLQQQLAADPSMQATEGMQNSVAELDVDIHITDAPETDSYDAETFKGIAEMVKSGVPPQLIVEFWPYGNKERISRVLKAQGQVPPEVQEQMQKMKEEGEKLAQENQALKADQQGDAAKLQLRQAEAKAELQMKGQIQAEELRLQKERQDAEIMLARQKAEAELRLKREIAAADLEIEAARGQLEQENREREMAHTQDTQRREMDFSQRQKAMEKMPDADWAKIYEAQVSGATEMPAALKSMAEAVAALTGSLGRIAALTEQSVALQTQTLATLQAPKETSIGAVRKDSMGQILGATVSTRPVAVN